LDKTQTELLQSFTIPQLLRWRVDRTGDKVALREKDFGRWNATPGTITMTMSAKPGWGWKKSGLRKTTPSP
jgi:long-chain acyl-CoA synthetase